MDQSKADLEKLYSPSRWSKRLSPDVIISQHVQLVTNESRKIKAEIQHTTHHYGQGDNEKIDVFQPPADLDRGPVLVFFSGGYWQELSGEISAYPAKHFYDAGITVMIVHYDRAPRVTFEEIIVQANNAVMWILEFARPKNRPIYLSGHSAGAHLCAMIFLSSWFNKLSKQEKGLFQGAFYLSGIFDLRPLVTTYVNEPLCLNEEIAVTYSPLLQTEKLNSNFPNELKQSFIAHIVVGADESPAFINQGQDLSNKMIEIGFVKSHLTCISNTDHFDIMEKLTGDKSYELTQLMLKTMLSLK